MIRSDTTLGQTTDNWTQGLWTDEVQRTENNDWENDVSTLTLEHRVLSRSFRPTSVPR